MADTPPASPDPARKPGLRFLGRLTAGIGGLIAAVASTGVAIYHARTAPGTPAIELGRPVEAGRWLVTLRAARAADRTPDGRKPQNGAFAVMVDADLLNRSGESTNIFGQVFRLVDAPKGVDPKPTLYLRRDGQMASALQPRLPEAVVVAWSYPDGASRPAEVRIAITGDRFKPKDNLYAAPGWFNPQVVGEARVTVAAQPEPTPEEGGR